MILLILGLALCAGSHAAFTVRPDSRHTPGVGHPRRMLLVTACALTGAVLIVAGKSSAAFIQVWVPPFALRDCAHLLMISACIAFAAGLVPASHTRALVRHPMLAGLVLAGIAHLLSNGDLASMLLFGVPTLWAALQLLVCGRQSRHSPSPPAMQWDTAAILLGMIAYGGLLVFHGPLFGFALTGPI